MRLQKRDTGPRSRSSTDISKSSASLSGIIALFSLILNLPFLPHWRSIEIYCVSFSQGICCFTAFSSFNRSSVISLPQPLHLIRTSLPTRNTENSWHLQGWGFFSISLSPSLIRIMLIGCLQINYYFILTHFFIRVKRAKVNIVEKLV